MGHAALKLENLQRYRTETKEEAQLLGEKKHNRGEKSRSDNSLFIVSYL